MNEKSTEQAESSNEPESLGHKRGFGMSREVSEYDYAGDRSRWGCFPSGRDVSAPIYQGFGAHPRRPPKGYVRSDERIREDVSERLAEAIDASEVAVQVQDGIVTFTGTVVDRETKSRMDEICERVSGVKELLNHVTYAQPVPLNDALRARKARTTRH